MRPLNGRVGEKGELMQMGKRKIGGCGRRKLQRRMAKETVELNDGKDSWDEE